jgi:hypothetical protein
VDNRYAVKEAYRDASVIDFVKVVVKFETILGENNMSPFLSKDSQVYPPSARYEKTNS